MCAGFLAVIGLLMQTVAHAQSRFVLQVYRQPLRPGSEAELGAIEEERARFSVALGCPHPYLGVKSLTGPKEIWGFNGYESAADQKEVADAYTRNTPLLEAYQRSAPRLAQPTLDAIDTIATFRADLSAGSRWRPGDGRFLVITATKSTRPVAGTVFEARDGTRFIVTATRTRQEADAAREAAGPESTIFAVRPSWSFPAKAWTAADPRSGR
jgi:hypothetical protein